MATLKSLVSRLRLYRTHHATRRDLSHRLHGMSSQELDALIRDIGISKSEMLEEASLPFWKAGPVDGSKAKSVRTDRKQPWSYALKVLVKIRPQRHCSEKSRMAGT